MTAPAVSEAAPAVPDAPKLKAGSKIFYGFGSVAFGVATLGLSSAVLQPYMNRVIGIPAIVVGTVLMITLILDAFIDPAIGRSSDNLRTKWGRRHPLMYASAPLVAMTCIAFWNSPADWSPTAVMAYLMGMLVAMRLAVSLYEVPSSALAPELTSDYHQRTSLFSYRYFFGVVGGFGMNVVLYQVFLSPANGGILSKAGYAQYGVLAATVMAISILISAIGTHHHIPRLAVPPVRRISTAEALKEVVGTLSNRSLVVVMLSGLCSGAASGMTSALSQYFYVEFWGLNASGVSYIALAAVTASIAGIAVAGPASKAMGKKGAMLTLFVVATLTGAMPIALRLFGLLPGNDSPIIFPLLVIDVFISTTLAIAGFILITSMIADVVEDAAVKTGVRSEGLLFAANSVLQKCTSGFGVFLSGVMLTVVAFPARAAAGTVDPEIMRRLAIVYLPVTLSLNLLSIFVLVFYKIDQDKHQRNLATLAEAAAMAEQGDAIESKPIASAAT